MLPPKKPVASISHIETFVIAPHPNLGSDTTLVLQPKDFVNRLATLEITRYLQLESLSICPLLVQLSQSKGRILATLIYKTLTPDPSSKRTGQLLILGICVDPMSFLMQSAVLAPAFKLFMARLSQITRMQMDIRGADCLLEIIQSTTVSDASTLLKGSPDINNLIMERLPFEYKEPPSLLARYKFLICANNFLKRPRVVRLRSIEDALDYWKYADRRLCFAKHTWSPKDKCIDR